MFHPAVCLGESTFDRGKVNGIFHRYGSKVVHELFNSDCPWEVAKKRFLLSSFVLVVITIIIKFEMDFS